MDEFLSYYGRVHERTARVIACVPPDKLEWRPREGAFSFGDLIRHLAGIERYMFAENAMGRPSTYPGHGIELAAGYANVIAYYERLHTESRAIIEQLTPAQRESRCTTPGGAMLPVWKWLRSMLEHEAHHRGQIYLMLNIIGVPTPALYGLTSEEVKSRSVTRNE